MNISAIHKSGIEKVLSIGGMMNARRTSHLSDAELGMAVQRFLSDQAKVMHRHSLAKLEVRVSPTDEDGREIVISGNLPSYAVFQVLSESLKQLASVVPSAGRYRTHVNITYK